MRNDKTAHALGLCAKARRIVCGTAQVCEALSGQKKPCLVLETSDNSENTAKRIADRCAFYQVERIRLQMDGDELASAIGKSSRVAVVAITDENLCNLVRGTLREEHS